MCWLYPVSGVSGGFRWLYFDFTARCHHSFSSYMYSVHLWAGSSLLTYNLGRSHTSPSDIPQTSHGAGQTPVRGAELSGEGRDRGAAKHHPGQLLRLGFSARVRCIWLMKRRHPRKVDANTHTLNSDNYCFIRKISDKMCVFQII